MYGLITTHSYRIGNKGKFHNHESEVDTLFLELPPKFSAYLRVRTLALGETLPAVGKVLSHSDIETTARLAHLRTRSCTRRRRNLPS